MAPYITITYKVVACVYDRTKQHASRAVFTLNTSLNCTCDYTATGESPAGASWLFYMAEPCACACFGDCLCTPSFQ